ALAFGSYDNNPNKGYTVTYSRGWDPKSEGTMVKGAVVRVKNKMIFDVTATDKS
ncbi:multiubiquitin domain-containing protein, partial [Kaistella yonginensis]